MEGEYLMRIFFQSLRVNTPTNVMENKTFSRGASSRKLMLLVEFFRDSFSRRKNLTHRIIFAFMKHKHWSALVYVCI